MNDNTVILLEQLANKLGTTSEYLWSILLKQAYISAITDLIFVIVIWLSGIILLSLHLYFSGYKRDNSLYDDYEDFLPMIMIVAALIWTVLFVVSIIIISSIVTAFINPEYWALKQILNAIK
jgi:hypothetical protein